jgi:predicted RNA-binding Zn ribbon-like protein
MVYNIGMNAVPSPGQLEFPFSAGRLCLDFTGTVGQRSAWGYERLREPADLGRWVVQAGLLERTPRCDEAALSVARDLREAIYLSLSAVISGRPASGQDVAAINKAASWLPRVPQLDPRTRQVSWVCARPLRAGLATVARDAVLLLGSDDIQRVRECAAADCSLLFLDSSRSGRRRWCSMERCGNRQKTASYRRRRSEVMPGPGARGESGH